MWTLFGPFHWPDLLIAGFAGAALLGGVRVMGKPADASKKYGERAQTAGPFSCLFESCRTLERNGPPGNVRRSVFDDPGLRALLGVRNTGRAPSLVSTTR